MPKKVVLNGDTATVDGHVFRDELIDENTANLAITQAGNYLREINCDGYHEVGFYGTIKLPIARRVMPDAPVLKPGMTVQEYLRAKYGEGARAYEVRG